MNRKARCPICHKPMPDVVDEGYKCLNCGYVFETPEEV